MDGFTALVGWSVFVALVAGTVGSLHQRMEVASECRTTGQLIVRSEIFKCDLTHLEVQGTRVPVNQEKKP